MLTVKHSGKVVIHGLVSPALLYRPFLSITSLARTFSALLLQGCCLQLCPCTLGKTLIPKDVPEKASKTSPASRSEPRSLGPDFISGFGCDPQPPPPPHLAALNRIPTRSPRKKRTLASVSHRRFALVFCLARWAIPCFGRFFPNHNMGTSSPVSIPRVPFSRNMMSLWGCLITPARVIRI